MKRLWQWILGGLVSLVLTAFLIGPRIVSTTCRGGTRHRTAFTLHHYCQGFAKWRWRHPDRNCPTTLDEILAAGLVEGRPVDDWGQPLEFICPGRPGRLFEIWTNGPDRVPGTPDDLTDSWEEPTRR
jgi:hypothetical protein